MSSPIIRWSSVFLPITAKRPRSPQPALDIRHIVTSGPQRRSIHSLSSVLLRCRRIQSKSLPSNREFTTQQSIDPELLEVSTDSLSSLLVTSSLKKEENEENLQTTSLIQFDDEQNEDAVTTTPLQNDETTATLPKDIIDVQIPGRDSQVIMVSDNLMEMLQQNSDVIKARMPKLEELETNEPMIGATPLILWRGEETYFQFDYRNHPPITAFDNKNLLRKIERVLRNIHLEPIGDKNRGVATMERNIENMKEGDDYRLSRRTYNKTGLFEPINALKPKTTRYTLIKSLTERHALYATGNNWRFGGLKRNVLGQSLFGVDSEIEVKARDTATILRDLWCFGQSYMFDGLQRRHFAMKRRKEQKILRKIQLEEMKHLSYPEPLVKHMEKEGKVGLATGNVTHVISVNDDFTQSLSPVWMGRKRPAFCRTARYRVDAV